MSRRRRAVSSYKDSDHCERWNERTVRKNGKKSGHKRINGKQSMGKRDWEKADEKREEER